MRNLKKILALVLALVMSLSLMATASAADTTAENGNPNYQTAATVLQKLDVVKGDAGTGAIRPTESITRAEVAALLYRIATGDVTDAQAKIHTGQPFTDVNLNDWYTGYISYCYISEIVKGNPNGSFEPNKEINGYATLAMILRAMGYGKNNEFVGDGWEIRTASIAKQIGILEGITDTQLSGAATRELVFEILFRAILTDTVTFDIRTPYNYIPTGETLAKTKLGMEEITGVVIANEIADLGDTTPLAEGRTDLLVGEKTYKMKDFSTTAEEIGTSIHAYVKNNEVLAHEAAANDIKDNAGAKTTVKNLRDGLNITPDTEYYVNYDPIRKDTSDWRLEYVVVLPELMTESEAAELVKANGGAAFVEKATNGNKALVLDTDEQASLIDASNVNTKLLSTDTTENYYTYDKVIPVEQIITGTDHTFIKNIFYYSDSFNVDSEQGDDIWTGEVYVATKSGVSVSVDKSFDVSDELSYKEFYAKYIDDDLNRSFDGCDRGEWLRVIDNDGDGDAEYVLRVDFVMTTITDYDKRTDTYTVEYDEDEKPGSANDTTIDASDIAVMSEDTDLSDGAVILYTLIDGVYHVCNPVVDTYAIEKKTIDIKTESFTANGETYTWSGIDKEAAEYYKELVELDEDVTYNLYLDHFGFVRLATEASKGLVLLTDGYYNTNYRDSQWQATIWNGTGLVDVDVKDCETDRVDPAGFIDETESTASTGTDHGNRGTWLRLRTFGQFYYDAEPNSTGGYRHEHYVDPDVANVAIEDLTKTPVVTANKTYADPFLTNIAAYVEEDGVYSLYDVTDVSTVNGLKRELNAYEVIGTELGYATANVKNETVKAKNRTLWGIAHNDGVSVYGWNGNTVVEANIQQVQTNGATVYYFVGKDSKGNIEVTSWTGYENVPAELGNFTAARAYMVSHSINDPNADYEIADVVVFEGAKEIKADEAWLIISAINTKRERSLGKNDDGNYGETNTGLEVFNYGQTLAAYPGSDSDEVLNAETGKEGLQQGQVVFFNADGDPIESNFAKYGIYAGTVNVAPGTRGDNYCEFYIDTTERYFHSFYTDDINAYELNQNTKTDSNRASRNLTVRDAGRIDIGDKLIVMCDKDMNVLMAVNVDRSGKDGERDGSITKLNTLWATIAADQDASKLWKITDVTFVDNADTAISSSKDIDLKVKEFAKSAASFVPELKGADAGEYQITKVEVTEGTARVMYSETGVATLFNVETNLKLKVTLSSAEYTVNIDSDNLDASDSVEVSYTGDNGKVVVADGDKVPYNTALSIAITKVTGDTVIYEVTANGGDPISASSGGGVDTYAYTVEGITNIVIAKTEKSNDGALTALTSSDDDATDPAVADLDDGDTPSITDFPYGTGNTTITFTVSPKATVKVWKGAEALNMPVTVTKGTADDTWTCTLDVGESGSGKVYVVQVFSEVGNKKTEVTLTLEAEDASDNLELEPSEAGTGKVKVEFTAATSGSPGTPASGTITILAAGETYVTVADVLDYVQAKGDAVKSIVPLVAANGAEITGDDLNKAVTSSNKIKVTAQNGTDTVEYGITFGTID